MLAVVAAILAAFGVLLNWPIFPSGFFPLAISGLSAATIAFGPGYSMNMGKMVLAVGFFMVVTFFMRPSLLLVRIRSILLSVTATTVVTATIQALRMHYPIYSCTGSIFSAILLTVAFLASAMRIGAVAPIKSSSQAIGASKISMQLKSVFARNISVSQAKKLYVTSVDDLHESWPKEVTQTFSKREITFGRDGQWADVRVGGVWGAVSDRHGKARVIGNSVFYEPIAGRYAFALDGTPCQKAKEIRQGAILSLVSGLGPRLRLELKESGRNGDTIPEVERKNEIQADNERLMRSTLRTIVILTLLSLALFGAFLAFQQHAVRNGLSLPGNSLPRETQQRPAVSLSGGG